MNVLVIDTETANSVEQPLPYDVGYAIVDTETGELSSGKEKRFAETNSADRSKKFFKNA